MVVTQQNAHDPVVMPCAVHESSLALRAFVDETAGPVATDGAGVEGQYPHIDPVKSHRAEGVVKSHRHGFPANPLADETLVRCDDLPLGLLSQCG